MALLSLIVPVFGVQEYLAECLDSILGQIGPERAGAIEVVAVDDCSPDRSGEILAGYAARDARVRVLTHATNQGLGAARNSGLDHATGEYVWFVDSDDWLVAGALDAVLARLAEQPDVLLVGYARSYPDGRLVPERPAGAGPALPAVFDLRSQPRVLDGLHIACNKVVRRDFLVSTGVRFAPGWYEDVSFSHPLLLAARRICVLDRVCYGYRQRPAGQITRTTTHRHTEVFDQWHRVMRYVEGRHEDLRPLVFQRMIWHYLGVLNHPDRIHRGDRRVFFGRIVADYRQFRPAGGYPRPPGVARVRFTLVAWNAFGLFELLRALYRSRTAGPRAVRATRAAVNRWYYRWQRRLPLRDGVAVYAGGSHQGYAGGPYTRSVAAVLEEARAVASTFDGRGPGAGGTQVLIVGDAHRAENTAARCYQASTRAALRQFARARLVVTDADLPAPVIPRPRQQIARLGEAPRTVPPARRVHAG